jgi:hypothetical protein
MSSRKTSYAQLQAKWLKRHEKAQTKLWRNHRTALQWLRESMQQFMVGSVASLLLLTTPFTSSLFSPFGGSHKLLAQAVSKNDQIELALRNILPEAVIPLTDQQEQDVSTVLSNMYGIQVSASLDGKRLNRSYGYIGKEQHLMRYPGDNIVVHFDSGEDASFAEAGMAPGRGAWGYWADSLSSLTDEQKKQEKYYIAVQTFSAPGWGEHSKELTEFFKYRKMLVVNPDNGKAVIAVIGDSGPAEWTGKSLGGSPEVMSYLERVDGAQKGPVLYFFINDPDNTVPLGPIQLQ